jgi:hypothetical protein
MAEAEIACHVEEAQARWPLLGVTVIHRYGRIVPGENIVLVVTASSHRRRRLPAEFLMDYLKTRAPFWKKPKARLVRPGSMPRKLTTQRPIVGKAKPRRCGMSVTRGEKLIRIICRHRGFLRCAFFGKRSLGKFLSASAQRLPA